jgi:predicted dehydrogenase
MIFLLLGFSAIVQRRVLPALAMIERISSIDVASRSHAPQQWPKQGRLFRNYAEALAESEADVVYISLPNAAHAMWVRAALASGKHVIVDKPATLTRDSAEECIDAARSAGRVLAEATVFAYHPHIAGMRTFFAELGPITHLDAQFIIPPLPRNNFRNSRELGGGCLNDMGPYAAGIARLFGGRMARLTAFAPKPRAGDPDVDIGFSLAAEFENGLRYTGHFSFESEYQNRLIAVGRSGSIVVERIFSPPADVAITWQARRRNVAGEERHPPADMFAVFLEAFLLAVTNGDGARFAQELLRDSAFRADIAAQLDRNA